MITQSTRRPLGSWKAVFRRVQQQRQQPIPQLFRSMATETTPTSDAAVAIPPLPPSTILAKPQFYSPKFKKSPFAIYPRVPSARKTHPAALESYHAQQITRLDRTGARRALFNKSNVDSARVGDVLQVTTRRGAGNSGEPFAGVLLSIRRAGVDTAILLRNHISKVSVEMWFKIFSPNVVGIEVVWRRPKRARRARLTYMRQPKHDMGNVDHLVEKWRRTRNVFTTKGKKAAAKTAAAGAPGAKR
ncbi:translation protein SH3-like domain-containing protein [Hypoxylon trugodes]|uniref:translation protein SH3-like domain-containing protein n=1 Tax=Hypoxylon trugodes TaxID=326681 RepID=UPI00219DC051|nr:translation protein SH3-like domain-containing protein [Hypoxylon trugodes]KAI1393417.1 translation protein SH3-like domain-containing protein [Hypoxylon trugodes]